MISAILLILFLLTFHTKNKWRCAETNAVCPPDQSIWQINLTENKFIFLFRVSQLNRTIYTNIYICLLVDIWGTYNLLLNLQINCICLSDLLCMKLYVRKGYTKYSPFTVRKANLSDIRSFSNFFYLVWNNKHFFHLL